MQKKDITPDSQLLCDLDGERITKGSRCVVRQDFGDENANSKEHEISGREVSGGFSSNPIFYASQGPMLACRIPIPTASATPLLSIPFPRANEAPIININAQSTLLTAWPTIRHQTKFEG